MPNFTFAGQTVNTSTAIYSGNPATTGRNGNISGGSPGRRNNTQGRSCSNCTSSGKGKK